MMFQGLFDRYLYKLILGKKFNWALAHTYKSKKRLLLGTSKINATYFVEDIQKYE